MKRLILTIAMIAGISPVNYVQADIYRFDGEDEVVSFSDTPNDKRFLLVMKDKQSGGFRSSKGKLLKGATKNESRTSGIAEQNNDLVKTLPIQGVITSPPGLRNDPLDGRLKHHNGFDIAAPSGTPVKPVAPGTVLFSGWKGGYGNTVILEHADGMITVYAHHSGNNVSAGATVDKNTVIALTGSTGRSTGPHLHFEAWQNDVNITSDFMPGRSSAQPSTTLANAPIRRFLQEDGTILFTNLR
jgi:murein DD-endopeptidase MepM/ murein hydrolase activator NlpD